MGSEPKTDLERVAALWDKTASDRTVSPVQGWLDSPIVLEHYVQPRITGSASLNWLEGFAKRLGIPKTSRWLSLGCGAGGLEIFACKAGLCGSMRALDVSEGSLEVGRQNAAKEGVTNIEFGTVDMNAVRLERGRWDVILMAMSLHHVKELGAVLGAIHDGLAPGGIFITNEFIGPRQFQYTDLQLSLVRELLSTLPEFWRRDSATGGIKDEYIRMSVEHWNVADPSEAIRSDRIVEEIERRFEVVERVDYGGTLMNLLLEHIMHNFDPADPKDVAMVKLLCRTEDILIRHGVIPSDFTVIAARPKGTAAPAGRWFRRITGS
jgi:ubiquinone/menaquinone biosynthesis C-methylase UbiE